MQKLFITIAAIILLPITVFSIGIYRVPIARVDGQFVLLLNLQNRLNAYQHLVKVQSDYDFQSEQAVREFSRQKKLILNNLIEEKILQRLASQKKVQISKQELEKYYQFLLNEFKIENPEAEIQKLFGWSVRKFKANIVLPDLLRAKFAALLLEEEENSPARGQAQEVLRRIQNGMSFEDAAAGYSEDQETKFIGGDLGFVSLKAVSPWLADAAATLKVNKPSEIVVSPQGYHILEVIEKDERSNPQKIHLRHILIREDLLSPLLEQRRESAKIWIWGKI